MNENTVSKKSIQCVTVQKAKVEGLSENGKRKYCRCMIDTEP
jgi:hypothetical protein